MHSQFQTLENEGIKREKEKKVEEISGTSGGEFKIIDDDSDYDEDGDDNDDEIGEDGGAFVDICDDAIVMVIVMTVLMVMATISIRR